MFLNRWLQLAAQLSSHCHPKSTLAESVLPPPIVQIPPTNLPSLMNFVSTILATSCSFVK